MKFAFIEAEKARFPIATLCRVLGVSRQGFYAYRQRPVPLRVKQDEALRARLRQLHQESRGTYGSPRMLAQLQREGFRVSKRRVERAMRSLGINVRPKRYVRRTTQADPRHTPAPNVLARDFTASRPNERWVTDISYVWTAEGWCYVAVILDLFSRAVVGWSLDANLSTRLALSALHMAIGRRRPADSLLHHSDRGCQYTSAEYRAVLEDMGVSVSMSRKGNCWDNAVAESFFATLKNELVYRRQWSGRNELRSELFEYLEVFYNRKRLHSTLAYRTPAQVDEEYSAAMAA